MGIQLLNCTSELLGFLIHRVYISQYNWEYRLPQIQ